MDLDKVKKFFSDLAYDWRAFKKNQNYKAKKLVNNVQDKLNELYSKLQEGIRENFKNYYKDNGIDISEEKNDYSDYYDKRDEYIESLKENKTFSKWLEDLGMSEDENSENYYGKYIDSAYEGRVSNAISSYNSSLKNAENLLKNSNTYAENAYNKAISSFNKRSENLYQNGLKHSGYDSYLKGISYVSYRDEIAKNRSDYSQNLSKIKSDLNNAITNAGVKRAESMNDMRTQLLKLYLSELSDKASALKSIYG
ncbi:MAG: hypothetical protein IKB66_01155 [Clostridia bacterium]|nr:hypothetical protein [Clostridia bacterium]